MKRALLLVASFVGVAAPAVFSQTTFIEDFDSTVGGSISTLPNWTSVDGTGLFDTDALVAPETGSEPAFSPPNFMRMVAFGVPEVSATWQVTIPRQMSRLLLSFWYELQWGGQARVDVAASPGGPFVDTGIFFTKDCNNVLDQLAQADVTAAALAAGVVDKVFVRFRHFETSGRTCIVFKVDSIVVTVFTPDLTPPSLSKPSPGIAGVDNTLIVTNATPGGLVGLAYSTTLGSTPVGSLCPGLTVGLDSMIVVEIGVANVTGTASFSGLVPLGFSGTTVYVQGLDGSACEVSNLVSHTFP